MVGASPWLLLAQVSSWGSEGTGLQGLLAPAGGTQGPGGSHPSRQSKPGDFHMCLILGGVGEKGRAISQHAGMVCYKTRLGNSECAWVLGR